MSLKSKIKYALIWGPVWLGCLTLPQIGLNALRSGQKIRPNGYTCELVGGVFPLTSSTRRTFNSFYHKDDNTMSNHLDDFSMDLSSVKYCNIDDINGDFKPDCFYQDKSFLYRKDYPEFFRDTVDPLWEKGMKELNVAEAHKEWMLKYGKDLLE